MAPWLFSELKSRNFHIKYVTEFIEEWALEGKVPTGWDQLIVTTEQLRREQIRLKHADHILTESPVELGYAYAEYYGCPATEIIESIVDLYNKTYPSIAVYIHREHPYDPRGRFQTEEQSKEVDQIIYRSFKRLFNSNNLIEVSSKDKVNTLSWIINKLENCHENNNSR